MIVEELPFQPRCVLLEDVEHPATFSYGGEHFATLKCCLAANLTIGEDDLDPETYRFVFNLQSQTVALFHKKSRVFLTNNQIQSTKI